MSELIRKFDLQFFADGASGGDGGAGAAEAGDNAADAGRTLEALGVPREAAERHRQRMEKKRGKAAQPAPQTAAASPAEEPGETGEKQTPPANAASGDSATGEKGKSAGDAGKDEWDRFFSDPANKERLEQMMSERGKKATEAKNAANAQMEKLSPMLKLLGNKYGVKPNEDGSYDLDAINSALKKEDLAERALNNGVSEEVQEQLDHADELDRQQQAAQAAAERRAMLQEHFNRVQQQAASLKELYPEFDLERELQDPEFVRRTAPGALPVEDAYYSLHAKEIMKRQAESIARQAKQSAAAAVQSGNARPRENGSATTAPAAVTPNMRAMTPQQRRAYIMAKYPPTR